MTAEASENIEKLVSILLTFSPEQMAEFVAGARGIITPYAPPRMTPCAHTPRGEEPQKRRGPLSGGFPPSWDF